VRSSREALLSESDFFQSSTKSKKLQEQTVNRIAFHSAGAAVWEELPAEGAGVEGSALGGSSEETGGTSECAEEEAESLVEGAASLGSEQPEKSSRAEAARENSFLKFI
jgi:hypothetical protein